MKHRMQYIQFGLILIAALAFSQEETVDRLTVPFSRPNEPGLLKLGLINGSITVNSYEGKEVKIESRVRMKKVREEREKKNKKNEGMIHIPSLSTELEVEENNNIIKIDVASHKLTMDVTLKVPKNTSLNLSVINNGDIVVDQIIGDIEADNINGDVRLANISGSVIANAHNGDLVVTLLSVSPNKPMSFSSFNEDVDVTFPASIKANVKMKTEQGEIFSDFQITKVENPVKMIQEKSHEKNGKYKVRIERAFYGTINGGGPEIQFNSYNGDILIRKAK